MSQDLANNNFPIGIMEVEGELSVPGTAQKSLKSRSNPADEVEDEENLFELEIKNLDTNEVFKMQIPIGSGEGHAHASD